MEKPFRVVLDASAMLRSDHDYRCGGYIIPNSVVQELKREKDRDALDAAVREGHVVVCDPRGNFRSLVMSAALETGDAHALSDADVDVLALAKEYDASVASDDYAIQNTAKKLGIPHIPTGADGIRREIRWVWACGGCGKKMEGPGICDVCGHSARRRRS